MALLSKQSVLSVDDFQYDTVPCPEWGGEMRVRGLTAAEQSLVYKRYKDDKTEDFDVIVCIMGCVDENGERIFTNEDKQALRQKSFAVLDRIAKKIIQLTGDNDSEGVEEARKN
jgi:hypothetical protein